MRYASFFHSFHAQFDGDYFICSAKVQCVPTLREQLGLFTWEYTVN